MSLTLSIPGFFYPAFIQRGLPPTANWLDPTLTSLATYLGLLLWILEKSPVLYLPYPTTRSFPRSSVDTVPAQLQHLRVHPASSQWAFASQNPVLSYDLLWVILFPDVFYCY